MKEILIYAAQVSALSLGSYLVYKAVFARDTLHRVRRFVLLGLLVASFALPVCRITVVKEIAAAGTVETAVGGGTFAVSDDTPAFVAPEEVRMAPAKRVPDLWFAAGIAYLAGVFALSVYRLAGVARARRIMRRAVRRFTTGGGVEVLLIGGDIPPFSFGDRIILSESDFESDGAGMILRHEATHIRQRHGVDLAVVNLAAALLWFDPFVWLLRRELILVHEIAADSGVIKSGIDAKKYQYLLISKIARAEGLLPVASHFRTSDLRKRIMTMKRKTSRAALFKTLLLLPLAALALAVFAKTRYVAVETTARLPDEPGKVQFHMPYVGNITHHYFDKVVDHKNSETGEMEKLHMVSTGIVVLVTNDTIRAPYHGVVTVKQGRRSCGVRIAHAGGLETELGPLYKLLVADGATVKGGDPIGIIGTTMFHSGNKSLGLMTWIDGKPVNPEEALPLDGINVEEPETALTRYRFKKEEFNMPFDGKKRRLPDGMESDTFGPVGLFGERIHPVTGEKSFHPGIDVVPSGDTVRAPYSGVVSSATFEQVMGNKLVITHNDGLETTYGHLAGFLVSEGEQVNGGQPIAIVGNTGLSTGKHLHIETRVGGKLTDPLETLFGMSVYEAENRRKEDLNLFISISTSKVPKTGTRH